MKTSIKLAVSAKEYFDFITNQLLSELPKGVKNKVKRADIKTGFKYQQTYHLPKGDFISKKEIIEYVYGETYRLQIQIPDGYQYIEHHILPLGDEEIELQYSETIQTKKLAVNLTHKLRSSSAKKRLKHNFKMIEEAIISKREATRA